MPTINGLPFSSIPNLNLKGVSSVKGSVLRFARTSSSSPIASTDYGLYVNAAGALVFSAAGVATTLGATGGSGSIPSLDAIFQGDQTLNLGGLSTLTIDRTSGNNDVLTLTNTGAGSGDTLQITNVGTGKDVNGTSGLWSFSKLGAGVALNMTLAGTADTTSLEVTQGDFLMSDGKITITDNDSEAIVTINTSGTTASAIVLAGTGTHTGTTTSSFVQIGHTGISAGTLVYIPIPTTLTTGKAVQIVATTGLTSGILLGVTTSATAITGAGRLLRIDHTGSTTSSGAGILSEFASAAADGTVILKITASAALATGIALQISGSSVTTGKAITASDLDALTTGMGVHIASAATAITTTGRLLLVDHTGATTSTGTLVEFKTAATDAANATTLLKLTMAATIVGVGLNIVSTTGLTTGSLIRATTATAGAIATNGAYTFAGTAAFTTTASTVGMFHIVGASTLTGTIMSILGGAQTTGIALNITDPSTGMTSGSLLRVITATTGAVASNGIVSVQASGAYTSTAHVGLLDVVAAAITGTATVAHLASTAASQLTTEILNITQSGATMTGYTGNIVNIVAGYSGTGSTGNAVLITSVATTQGNALKIVANAITLGAATGILVSHTTSVLGAGVSLVRIASTGIDTGTTTGVLLDLSTTAAVGSTQVLLTDSSADTAARIGISHVVSNALAVGAIPFKSTNAATVSTHWYKHIQVSNGTQVNIIWQGDGTTSPNTALSGTAGDIAINNDSSKAYYCTGTTNWTAL